MFFLVKGHTKRFFTDYLPPRSLIDTQVPCIDAGH